MLIQELLIYGIAGIFCLGIIYFYYQKGKKASTEVLKKIETAKYEGRFEPQSLHPYIDLNICIGSGACVKACPEQDILGIVHGNAQVINASNCIGHGACFHSCPVEAISLRIGTEKRGVELPHVNADYETNLKGIYIAGELGGMGLIKNSTEQGILAMQNIAKSDKPKIDGVLDVLIIGAGPAGIAASLTAKKLNLSFETLEQDSLGGTVSHFPREKVVMTHPMDLPLKGKVKLTSTSKVELLNLWSSILSENNMSVLENTKVDKIVPLDGNVFKVVTKDGKEFKTNHVLLAIGRRGTPRKLNIQGEELQKVAYRLIEPEKIQNKNILVVGGGDSAVESAMMLMKNNKVILSYRKEQFARIKSLNREKIDEAIQGEKLEVLFKSNLMRITPDSVFIMEDGKKNETKVDNDLVYIFAGGELPTTFLESIGIKITKRFGQIVKKHK
ncbi:MAG: NAD(P)-binding domain-containing protein [Salinivirgaceae bacterium]|jgi:thioredoxin reductase (NADPH)|nr:NAD(P)-binding domain-containing protein [Salinivirgaceae bacterium]